ncbi:(d)CMP kinase [Cohaesibacter haloalkalitolerans]|uniref:(d)CMP kinase n=1 Tax=Cohaesibacter haloalkalitolerans TaxID=1162980 RepID=UPI000E657A7E|nr:(d)CMP kinase [Cohaesibacter haloalkalitolerans]
MIIAIDGPAASGKGTLSRKLAEHFALPHLDTGLTFRAVAHALLTAAKPLDDEDLAEAAAQALDLAALDRSVLSAHAIGEAASKVAVMPRVRQALLEAQRAFANRPGGAILDGRDIGTVVCPDADVKLFVTASAEIRARRRTDEILARGQAADYAQILEDVKKRDERDQTRAVAPLIPAEDAHLLDTTKLDIEGAFQQAVRIVEETQEK